MNNIKPINLPDSTAVNRTIPIKRADSVNSDNKKLMKAAKDMESLFMYHIIRAMRNTVPKNQETEKLGLGDGLGKDIYTQMLDEELSKKISGDGDNSLANLLYKSLVKIADKEKIASAIMGKSGKDILPEAKFIKIKNDGDKEPIKIQAKTISSENQSLDKSIKREGSFVPLSGRRIITTGPDETDVKIEESVSGIKEESRKEYKTTGNASNRSKYNQIINEASEKYQIDASLLESIIKTESGGDTTAISRAGAKGLMQLADSTASDMGVRDVFDPEENIHGGAKYLRTLMDRFGDIKKVLAAYNAGPETVKRYGGIPPYPETEKYVKTVLANMSAGPRRFE
jgi:Rod binding domain-containing protein